jgi:hypothetical protein
MSGIELPDPNLGKSVALLGISGSLQFRKYRTQFMPGLFKQVSDGFCDRLPAAAFTHDRAGRFGRQAGDDIGF